MIHFIHLRKNLSKIGKLKNDVCFFFFFFLPTTIMAKVAPIIIPKYHQLKNELLAFFSSSKLWSNWSAAKVCAQGLCPPSPTANI